MLSFHFYGFTCLVGLHYTKLTFKICTFTFISRLLNFIILMENSSNLRIIHRCTKITLFMHLSCYKTKPNLRDNKRVTAYIHTYKQRSILSCIQYVCKLMFLCTELYHAYDSHNALRTLLGSLKWN